MRQQKAKTIRNARKSGPDCTASGAGNLTFVRILTRLAPVSLLLGLSTIPSMAAAEWQSIGEIASTAETFLAKHLGQTAKKATLVAGRLDPRLQLPSCDQHLSAFLQRGAKMTRRMTVGVRCSGASPWKIYVPVDVVVTEPVVIVARTLPKGHVLTADDITTAPRDVASLTTGYLSAAADAVGRRLKHQIVEGRVLTPAMVKEDVVIQRGQSVTLTVRSDSLNIRMEGKALMDGSVNQRIRVRNLGSQRVIEGIVRSPEHVEVLVF